MYDYFLYSSGKYYSSEPGFLHRDQLPGQGFIALYAVTEETAKAITAAGSAKGFKGVVQSKRLWLDFDSYEECDKAEAKIIERGWDYVAYDTGGRGGHFGLLRTHAPSHLLPLLDRQWVAKEFPKADQSIYSHLHLFRLPGTVHERTGGRKELVGERKGSGILLSPLTVSQMSFVAPPRGRKSIFDCRRVMFNSIPLVEGAARHPTLIRLIYGLKDEAGVDAAYALWWVGEVNKLWAEPKSEEELEKAVRSIYET